MENSKGLVTIPTDLDVVPETLELMKRWGADAVSYTHLDVYKRQDVRALKDDKSYQVNYFCSTVVRKDALEKYPKLKETLELMDGILTDQKMAELNYQVEEEGRDEAEVAEEFLKTSGFCLLYTSYTDVWVSMGEPDEVWEKRIRELTPYKVTKEVMENAKPEAIFLHCLPAVSYTHLTFLASHPNHVYTKEELFREIWDMESIGDIATVTVHIKKIREKIEYDTSHPQYIETIWGVGYRFKV